MEKKINNADLSFICKENWDKMESDGEEGRFCNTCQKKVYDLTDKKTAYFIRIMQDNNNNVCGRFTSDQLAAPDQIHKSIWKKWTITAMLFIGFGAAWQETSAQTGLQGKIVPKETKPDCDKGIRLGVITLPASNKELTSLHHYLVQNCKVPNSINGRLIISFTVKKDGSLANLALSNQLSELTRREVMRVLKNAPNWEKKNREYNYPYSLSLTFKDGKLAPYKH
ncbi:hypothetical protein H7F33_13830 [Pedobacter sp. PAMC26386]|nr:hypothetical protein H7F33_13830 [Pedobacter sp. PAMC26386]